MKTRLAIALLMLLSAAPVLAEGRDEVANWRSVGVEKSLTKGLSLGLEVEHRAQKKERVSFGLGLGYKINKHLKVGVAYDFIYSVKNERTKEKNDLDNYPDEFSLGYNLEPEYWFPRHRFSAEASGSIKLWKCLRVSLRERYQITRRKGMNADRLKHREDYATHLDFDEDWNPVETIVQENVSDVWDTKYVPAETDQVLRSRLKLELDKKHWHVSPFVSAEAHNSVAGGHGMLLQKVRTAVGASYKWRKRNEITLAYIATFQIHDVEDGGIVREHDRLHSISMGYNFSF